MNAWTDIADFLTYQTIYLPTLLGAMSCVPIRGSIFTGFLTLGGILLTSLSFITTRIHDMMKTTAYQRRAQWMIALRPGVSLANSLKTHTQQSKMAVTLCFATSFYQVVFGGIEFPLFQLFNVLLIAVTTWVVWRLATSSIQTYFEWLAIFERGMAEEAEDATRKSQREAIKKLDEPLSQPPQH